MSVKTNISTIKEMMTSRGYTLLSNKYINKYEKLEVECPSHGTFSVSFDVFRRTKYGCSACAHAKVADKNRGNIEDAKRAIVDAGYEPLFDTYSNSKDRLPMRCPKHGEISISLTNIRHGKRCYECGRENVAKKNRLDIKEVQKRVKSKGFTPKFESYSGNKDSLLCNCSIHGDFYGNLQSFTYGHGCQKCAIGKSKSQEEVYEFIKSLYLDAEYNNRTQIKPYEIDIYVPSKSIGIEYCGLVWHSEKYTGKNAHINKTKLCLENGIRLITIFEDEWLERQEQVKGFLRSALGKNERKLDARKCQISEMSNKDAYGFMNTYHIQGKSSSQVSFGLFYDGECVGLMSGNKHHRQGFDHIFVLNRLVFKSGVSVRGGCSRLLKRLIEYAQKCGYSSIISWSDNRWSVGEVYKKLGFVFEEELGPDYSYVFKNIRLSKQSCKKASLIKRGAIGSTEKEMAHSLGYQRIWDCGKIRWKVDL